MVYRKTGSFVRVTKHRIRSYFYIYISWHRPSSLVSESWFAFCSVAVMTRAFPNYSQEQPEFVLQNIACYMLLACGIVYVVLVWPLDWVNYSVESVYLTLLCLFKFVQKEILFTSVMKSHIHVILFELTQEKVGLVNVSL